MEIDLLDKIDGENNMQLSVRAKDETDGLIECFFIFLSKRCCVCNFFEHARM
jgi:hypothetical protein